LTTHSYLSHFLTHLSPPSSSSWCPLPCFSLAPLHGSLPLGRGAGSGRARGQPKATARPDGGAGTGLRTWARVARRPSARGQELRRPTAGGRPSAHAARHPGALGARGHRHAAGRLPPLLGAGRRCRGGSGLQDAAACAASKIQRAAEHAAGRRRPPAAGRGTRARVRQRPQRPRRCGPGGAARATGGGGGAAQAAAAWAWVAGRPKRRRQGRRGLFVFFYSVCRGG